MSQLHVPMIAPAAVDRHRLGVQEPGRVLEDAHAALQDLPVVGMRSPEHELLVGNANGHEAHVGARQGRGAHGVEKGLVRDEVGRLDPDGLARFQQRDDEGVADRLERGRDAGVQDLYGCRAFRPARHRLRQVACGEILTSPVETPEGREQDGEGRRDRPGQAHVGVAPAGEAPAAVDVFLAHVHATRVDDLSVHERDLHVVAIVDLPQPLEARPHLAPERASSRSSDLPVVSEVRSRRGCAPRRPAGASRAGPP